MDELVPPPPIHGCGGKLYNRLGFQQLRAVRNTYTSPQGPCSQRQARFNFPNTGKSSNMFTIGICSKFNSSKAQINQGAKFSQSALSHRIILQACAARLLKYLLKTHITFWHPQLSQSLASLITVTSWCRQRVSLDNCISRDGVKCHRALYLQGTMVSWSQYCIFIVSVLYLHCICITNTLIH